LHILLLTAFALAAVSLVLRKGKLLGTVGISLTLLAAMLGGSQSAAVAPDVTPLYLGLDFFVLRILFTGFLFIPLERIFAQWKEQPIFRTEWREDLFYYLVSSLLVQILTFLTFIPAKSIHAVAPMTGLRAWVSGLPFVVQFLAIMFSTDLVQYWVHRAFHRFPRLWKFHAVHHSAQNMDWMAGARMHFLEILALRGSTVIPMFVLGFRQDAVNVYIFVVYLYATFCSCQSSLAVSGHRKNSRHATLSPLASRHRRRGGRRKLCRSFPFVRPFVWNPSSSEGSLAGRLRRARSSGAEGLRGPIQVSVQAMMQSRGRLQEFRLARTPRSRRSCAVPRSLEIPPPALSRSETTATWGYLPAPRS
jgi:sterol desaturase/sphingolipid hydroxylase (fatty acid hydroxylase superfamily)